MMNLDWDHSLLSEKKTRELFRKNVSPDPLFPQLFDFFEQEIILNHLKRSISLRGMNGFAQAEIVNVRYLFGKHFHAVYRLLKHDSLAKEVYLVIRFFPPGQSRPYFQKTQEAARDQDSIIHLSEWDAVAFLFPEDPSLRFLHKLVDKTTLSEQWAGLSGTDQGDWELMSYHPETRCSIRYHSEEVKVIGKIEDSEMSLRLHQSLLDLWKSKDRRFKMAFPLGIDETCGIRWQSFVKGQRVDHLALSSGWNLLVRLLASGLANFHRMEIPSLKRYGLQDVIRRMVRKRIPRIRRTLSPLTEKIDLFSDRLLEEATHLPESPPVMIHGDLNTSNILVDEEETVFLDLDLISAGDRENDLAFISSRLILSTVQEGGNIEEVAKTIEVFIEAYSIKAGVSVSRKAFAWYLAAHLVGQQIKTCVGHRAPTLGRIAPVLLDYAVRTLEQGSFQRVAMNV